MEKEIKKDKKKLVYMDHDGSAEDIMSMMMVLGMDHVELIGVTMTPADCHPESSLELTLKSIQLFEKKIEVALGDYHSPNQFPYEYKISSIQANNIPYLINIEIDKNLFSHLPAGEFMAKKIKNAPEKVTVLVTGPLSHVARAFDYDPSIIEKIEEIVFMGGAIDVEGNVFQKEKGLYQKVDAPKPAEWNVYWDIDAAIKVLHTKIPFTMVSLDITNYAPVRRHHLKEIAKGVQEFNLLNIVGQFYALLYNDQWMEKDIFFFWDTLSTSYLGSDSLSDFETIEIDIIPSGDEEGKTIRKPGSGFFVKVPTKVDHDKFFAYFLKLMSRNVKI